MDSTDTGLRLREVPDPQIRSDPRVRTVQASDDCVHDAAAIKLALGGDADTLITALGRTPTTDLTMVGFDALRSYSTMVVLGGVREALSIPYGELMRRRLTLRGLLGGNDPVAYWVWRQIDAGLIDLHALDVRTVGPDDPDGALTKPEATTGLGFVAILP